MAASYTFTPDPGPQPAIKRGPDGRRTAYGTLTFGSTYANPSGTAITAALHPQILSSTAPVNTWSVEILDAVDTQGIAWKYDPATGKLKAFWGGGAGAVLTEVTNGQALSGSLRVAISGQ